VACDDNVFDFEVKDCELDDRKQADIGVVDNVGDVAMDEDFTGLAVQYSRLGYSRICTPNPENRRRLAFGASWEEVGVFAADLGRPFLVAIKAAVIGAFCSGGHDVSVYCDIEVFVM